MGESTGRRRAGPGAGACRLRRWGTGRFPKKGFSRDESLERVRAEPAVPPAGWLRGLGGLMERKRVHFRSPRRACQPFLMGKAPQRPALSRDTPKSGAPTLKRLCPAGANSVDSAHWQHILAPAGQGCVIQPAAGGRLLRLSLPPSIPSTAPNPTEPQHICPLLVGRACVNPAPKALAGGSAAARSKDHIFENPFGKTSIHLPRHPRPPKPAAGGKPPARGLAAVNTPHRPNRTEPQHTRPLLVGRVCVNPAPTALASGTAGFVIFSSRHLPFSARFAMVYL